MPQFKEIFRSVIQNMDYSINFLRRLEPEVVVKLLYLISQIEQGNGNKAGAFKFYSPFKRNCGAGC